MLLGFVGSAPAGRHAGRRQVQQRQFIAAGTDGGGGERLLAGEQRIVPGSGEVLGQHQVGAGLQAEGKRAWLAGQGVTGYGQALLVWERFGYPDFLTAEADELIAGQYTDRPQLRPVLDAVLAALPAIGRRAADEILTCSN